MNQQRWMSDFDQATCHLAQENCGQGSLIMNLRMLFTFIRAAASSSAVPPISPIRTIPEMRKEKSINQPPISKYRKLEF